jgi:hypothetical protein
MITLTWPAAATLAEPEEISEAASNWDRWSLALPGDCRTHRYVGEAGLRPDVFHLASGGEVAGVWPFIADGPGHHGLGALGGWNGLAGPG